MRSCVFFVLMSLSVAHAVDIIFRDFAKGIEGSECKTKSGVKGFCRRLYDCPYEAHMIKNFPLNSKTQLCSYTDSQQPIVCCAEACLRPSYLACESRRRFEKHYEEIHPYNGKEALHPIHPHVVALGYRNEENDNYDWLCAGSLLNKYYVLTAAHCVANQGRNRPDVIRAGVHNLTSSEGYILPVESFILHPSFDAESIYHDIALLKVTVTLGDGIRPICLPYDVEDPKFSAVLGWGATDIHGTMPTPIIQIAELRNVSSSRCNESYAARSHVSRRLGRGIVGTQICAEGADGLANGCAGDSGGPLQTLSFKYSREDGHVLRSVEFIIVGITSFGKLHYCSGISVYTRVGSYLDWIESVVWPHGFIEGEGER